MPSHKERVKTTPEAFGAALASECESAPLLLRPLNQTTGTSIVLFCAMLGASLVGTSCSRNEAPEAAPTVSVQVATAEKTTIQRKVNADAVLYPLNQASLVPKINAPVSQYYVNRGSHVHAGELMAKLENQDLAAAATENKGGFDQAQAVYEEATKATVPEEVKKAELDVAAAKESYEAQQKVYESRQLLLQQGAIARKEVDDARVTYVQAKNQYEIAKQHLESIRSVTKRSDLKSAAGQLSAAKGKYLGAQAQLSYSEIRSPINGVVTDRPLNLGEVAVAGSPVITVMDISQVIARAHVAQQEAASLKVGDAATITAPGISDGFPGKVTIVSPALDPNSTTVEVWVQAANRGEKLRPGTSVRVTIVAETIHDAIVIPTDALLTDPDGAISVIVASGDKPVLKPVKTGIKDTDNVQIVEGLAADEKVVTVGAFELSREDPDVLAKTKIQIQTPASGNEDKSPAKDADKDPTKD